MKPLSLKPLLLALFVGGGAACVIGCSAGRPDRAFEVVTGLISHNLCSEVFVTGVEPHAAYAQSLEPRPGMGLVNWAVRYDVDTARKQVSATVAGAFLNRAIYRNGLGCLVVHGGAPADAPASGDNVEDGQATTPLLPEIAGPAVVEPTDERLRAALDRAFVEPDHPPYRWTKAVIVVHGGRIIAERYASGYGVNTPLLGYSATKSVVSALVGILVRQGRLAVERRAPVAAWSDPNDPRHSITIDQLLRMTSGLALDESGNPFSPVARMLYGERDMGGFAESAGLEAQPGRTNQKTISRPGAERELPPSSIDQPLTRVCAGIS